MHCFNDDSSSFKLDIVLIAWNLDELKNHRFLFLQTFEAFSLARQRI